MGLMGSVIGYAKTRATQRILTRFLGGPLSTALMAAFLGKKAWDYYRSRSRVRAAYR
ncbi:MAG TPA: hypothetical protein VES20_17915 [Bryobacteraceae bacterium]|nr:hypothetical protein [Bryobacteraceae bacterium]